MAHDGLGRLRAGERLNVVQTELPGYEHLRAFDEVAVSLTDGLRDAGFDVDMTKGRAIPGRRNILLGAHVLGTEVLRSLPRDTIIYNHEQIEGSSMLPPNRLAAFGRLHRWDYSRRNAESWRAAGLDASHVPIGWSPTLRTIERLGHDDVDVLFYGSLNDRRRAILRGLEVAGARVRVAFGLYGAERDEVIAASRLVINIQYYEARILEMVRLSHLFANGVPVVSERSAGIDVPPGFDDAALFAVHDELVRTTLAALEDPKQLEAVGERGRQRMEEHPWRRCLDSVLPAGVTSGAPPAAAPAPRSADRRHKPKPLSPFGVVVLGMHRSGTSALTEVLADLGLSPGDERHLLAATPSNPRGHFEPAPLVQANDAVLATFERYWHAPVTDLAALRSAEAKPLREQLRSLFAQVFPEHGWVYKDPRLCVLWPLYEKLFPLPPLGVFLARAPEAVAASLHRRDRMSVSHALQLWEYYNRVALSSLPSFSHSVVVTHDRLMAEPAAVAERLSTAMAVVGMEVDPHDLDRAGATIEPRLARATAAGVEATPSASQLELWHQICALADGESTTVEPPSAELRTAMEHRACLVNANIQSLKLGWLEPTAELHRPQ